MGYWGSSGYTGSFNSTLTTLTISNTTVATNTTTGALQVVGGVGVGQNIWVGNRLYVGGIIETLFYTTATLPPAATVLAGARAFVADANTTTFYAGYVGSGAYYAPIFSDGTGWHIG